MDVVLKTENGRFNYRVCAMMIHEGKILAMHDDRSPYFYLPGGRVALHERAEDAVLRELREELGIEAKIDRPLWLNQSFFTEDVDGDKYHELCIYFLIDISGTDLLARGDSFTQSEGRRIHTFQWLPKEQLREAYFYPMFLKEDIFHLPGAFTIRTEIE